MKQAICETVHRHLTGSLLLAGRAALCTLLLLAGGPLTAQTSISADGIVESTAGFRFPDGTVQTTAADGGAFQCASGDLLPCYGGTLPTMGVGLCRAGARPCNSAGTGFDACVGEVLPAPEVCDGFDNDCNGAIDDGIPCDGELVISEILYDSSQVPDENFEWLEVFNPNPNPVNMLGWVLKDQAGSGQQIVVILANVVVEPGAFAVLCANAEPSLNGGVICDYEYGHFTLANTADEVILEAGGVVVDAVAYDESGGWPAATSGSLSLDPTTLSTADNDLPASWCNSPDGGPQLPNGDEGTPGAPNVPCP